jgi:hypothetical protein
MNSEKGSPSGVLITAAIRHIISLRPGLEAVKTPTFIVFPFKVGRATTLSAEIEYRLAAKVAQPDSRATNNSRTNPCFIEFSFFVLFYAKLEMKKF